MKRLVLTLIVLLGLTGCGKDEIVNTPGLNTSVIMPLKVGNIWQYVYQEFDSTSAVNVNQVLYIRIDSSLVVADETWFVPATVSINLLYTNRADGFWIWQDGQLPTLAFKYPAEVGDTYDYGDFRMTVTSDNYPVTVPNGTFSCYRYIEAHPGIDQDTVVHFYTPGVGLIRRDEIIPLGDGRSRLAARWSLSDFELQ